MKRNIDYKLLKQLKKGYMDNSPVLSICIPIYNRKSYLEKMLSRFLEDKDLFDKDIQLYISDNCSTEDIHGAVMHYADLGLRLTYHCNERNLGMDGNFINCFNHAEGKYVWLLGSDDIPRNGFLGKLIKILSKNNYGLLHVSDRDKCRNGQIIEYDDKNKFLEDIHVWITFISGNIVRADKRFCVNLDNYTGTFICQVPLYLYSILTSSNNAIYYQQYLESQNDSINNGGYNLFRVFVDNLFRIYQEFVEKGLMTRQAYENAKWAEYKEWLVDFVVAFLVLGKDRRKNFDLTDAWSILRKHYGQYLYFYYYTLKSFTKRIIRLA